ncbi:MAG TPA: stage II sporulation protein M [Longimicrobiales bacterium]|nr:stage II sporulation protein M [Longimicrobiales bacterium]
MDAVPSPTGFDHLDQARTLEVETPEHVALGFELAGFGSRAAAAILDFVLIAVIATALFVTLVSLPFDDLVFSVGGSILLLALFALQAGYFFLLEWRFNGRTPGKRWMGLRVVHDGGVPLTARGAALRNLLRPIDMQPFGSSLVGLGLIGFMPKAQRLGDMVGGTVVVRDRHTDRIPEVLVAERSAGRPVLDPVRFDVLSRYVARRDSLPREVRTRLAGRVAQAMGPAIENHPDRRTVALDDLLVELHASEAARQDAGTNRQAVQLVRTQQAAWNRYEELVDRAGRRGLGALSPDELEEFTALYRQVTSDLARARTYGASLRLCFELERLVSAGHNLFYRGSRSTGVSVGRWLATTFPRQVRAHRVQMALSAALLFLPALWIYGEVRRDGELGRRLASPAMATRAEEAGDRLARGEPYVDVPPVMSPMFSSGIMTNNLRVALTTAAGGILAGVGTAAILLFNGIHLGSVFALFDNAGAGLQLWWFVLPHGVLELTAIVIAGAAGMVLASAIFLPGRRTRGDALREQGPVSLSLVAGALLLLVPAGLIEGFISPSATLEPTVKMSFAAVVAALLFAYLGLAGREPRFRRPARSRQRSPRSLIST